MNRMWWHCYVWLFVPFGWMATPLQAHAWGYDGHRIICDIAWREMTAEAKSAASQILGIDTAEEFAEECLWADKVIRTRSGYANTGTWHYLNVPKGATSVDRERDCTARGCVLTAIDSQTEILRSSPAFEERTAALRFVIHLVGDVHQPLHVSFEEDRGGNSIRGRYFNRATNFHEIWDVGLIDANDRPWQELSAQLSSKITDTKRSAWLSALPEEWANESLRITLSPDVGYTGMQTGFELGGDYQRQNWPTVTERLSAAGVRLGALLNELLR